MEFAALVAETFLAGAECSEVIGRLGDYIVVELEVDSTTFCYGSTLVKSPSMPSRTAAVIILLQDIQSANGM
jgi:hypothetical protein